MFVFKENEWDISFITIDYRFILRISFIFYTNMIFLTEQDKIEQ